MNRKNLIFYFAPGWKHFFLLKALHNMSPSHYLWNIFISLHFIYCCRQRLIMAFLHKLKRNYGIPEKASSSIYILTQTILFHLLVILLLCYIHPLHNRWYVALVPYTCAAKGKPAPCKISREKPAVPLHKHRD